MSQLIGTAPNQVPVNAYLGSMAYQDSSQYFNAGQTVGFRNRIINGAMTIDQRNSGGAVTGSSSFPVDRFSLWVSQASKLSFQQNGGGVTPPAGFKNYLGVTTTTAYTPVTSDYFFIQQGIEGFNVADMGWGTANAQPFTLSFWIRSSLPGVYGGALQNGGQDRVYPFTYNINVANTWEYKTIVVPGDTTGTWPTNNSCAMYVNFSVGMGPSRTLAAGSWQGTTSIFSANNATSPVAVSGATWYITGVQLEKGVTATPFDFRSYLTELLMCQRYFFSLGGDANYTVFGYGGWRNSTQASIYIKFPVVMRAAPSLSTSNLSNMWIINASTNTVTGAAIDQVDTNGVMVDVTGASGSYGNLARWIAAGSTAPRVQLSAEL